MLGLCFFFVVLRMRSLVEGAEAYETDSSVWCYWPPLMAAVQLLCTYRLVTENIETCSPGNFFFCQRSVGCGE